MIIKRLLFVIVMLFCSASLAYTQNYPIKPVTIIIPFSVGSATDIIARALGKELSRVWDQPIICENIPGKGGTIAAGIVARSPADGYTLFVHGAYAINPSFYSDLPYDPLADFTNIVPLAKQPLALVVGSSSRIKSISNLIAEVKSERGKLRFGSPGTGSAAHLTAEKFRIAVGLEMKHVPFDGGPEAVTAINAGEVTFCFLPAFIAKKFSDKNQLRVLGVTSRQRSSVMPHVPTITEIGLSGFEYNHWWGLWAPKAIPIDVLSKIEKDTVHSLATPDIQKLFSKFGAEPMEMTSSEFTKFVVNEMQSVEHIVIEAGIKPK